MRRRLALACVLAASALGGCISLAPTYTRPTAPIPAAFPQGGPYQAADAAAALAVPPDWATVFRDPHLQGLIRTALTQNRDLRQTVANVRAAHAQFEVQRSQLLPTLTGNASATYQHLPAALGGSFEPSRLIQAGLGVSGYEVDLFGRLRNLSDAAFQQYLASDEGRRAAQITLVAEVATAYLQLAADRSLLAVSVQTQTSAQQSLNLTQARFDHGEASGLDVSQAQTVVQQARADAAGYAVATAQAKDALDLLVGQTVADADVPADLEAISANFAPVPASLNSSVLLARPDVLQAESLLRAANAQIGAARAAFFPSITLTGSDGLASSSLGTLFKGGNSSWSFTPAVSLPIFAGGRNIGNLRAAKADRDAALAAYDNAIQSAFKDVADALASAGGTVGQLEAQQALVEAAAEALKLATARYERGADTYLNMLIAQRTLYAAQEALVTVRLANVSSRVTLYRALGGGA